MTHPLISMSHEIARSIPPDVPMREISIVGFAATLLAIRTLPVTSGKDKR